MKEGKGLPAGLCQTLQKGAVQTILLDGGDARARLSAANRAAAMLLCQSEANRPCGKCHACRAVQGGHHTDLTIIDEGAGEIKVEVARRLKRESILHPNDSDRRVTIICHAENMNPSAQNALLKLLEEPPRGCYYLLLCARQEGLLQTIRSRCVRFSLGGACNEGYPAAVLSALAPYLDALCNKDEAALFFAAGKLSALKKPEQAALCEAWQAAMHDALLLQNGIQSHLAVPALSEQCQTMAARLSRRALLWVSEYGITLQDRLSRHAGKNALVCGLCAEVYQNILA